jgi:hypothetical protein
MVFGNLPKRFLPNRPTFVGRSRFTKPPEQLTTGWKFNSGGAGQAAQSTVKTSTPAAQSSFTTRLDPSVGAFVPGASDYFWKPGNSTSSTQTRSYGDLPPGGGTSARAGWGTTRLAQLSFCLVVRLFQRPADPPQFHQLRVVQRLDFLRHRLADLRFLARHIWIRRSKQQLE